MKTILVDKDKQLYLGETSKPELKPEDLLIAVKAFGLNRADLLQAKGLYPPPPGESNILGLEVAGEVIAIGSKVREFKIGDRVFGLVGSGAYAEYALLDQGLAFILPDHFSFLEGAAIAEAFLTAHETVCVLGGLAQAERILIHAGASSVGLTAMQLAFHLGAEVFATAGSELKIQKLLSYGVQQAFNYKAADFQEQILEKLGRDSINLILDFVSGPYVNMHQTLLAPDGRWLFLASMGGRQLDLDAAILIRKRFRLQGFNLRSQSLAQKRAIKTRFEESAWPFLMSGKLKPIIDSVFSFEEIGLAHQRMSNNENIGKIVIQL